VALPLPPTRWLTPLLFKKTYPMDERYWLLTSSYNTGIECLQYSFALSILHVTYIYSFS